MSTVDELQILHDSAKTLHESLNKLVKGKKVRIISDWNGQPWGKSKPSKKGEIFTVRGAEADVHWGTYLWLEGERVSIRASQVEWL